MWSERYFLAFLLPPPSRVACRFRKTIERAVIVVVLVGMLCWAGTGGALFETLPAFWIKQGIVQVSTVSCTSALQVAVFRMEVVGGYGMVDAGIDWY